MEIAGKDRVIQRKEWKDHFKKGTISQRKTEALWNRLDNNGSGRVTYAEFDDYICSSIENGMKLDYWLVKDRMPEFEEDNKKEQNDVRVKVRGDTVENNGQQTIANSAPMEEVTVVKRVLDVEKVASKKAAQTDTATSPTSQASMSSLYSINSRKSTKRINEETERKRLLCRDIFMDIAGKDRVVDHNEWTGYFKDTTITPKKSNRLWKKANEDNSGRLTYAEFDSYISDSIERGKKEHEWLWDGSVQKKQETKAIMIEDAKEDEEDIVEVDQVEPVIERIEKKEKQVFDEPEPIENDEPEPIEIDEPEPIVDEKESIEVVEPIVNEVNDKEPNENEFVQFNESHSADRTEEASVKCAIEEKEPPKVIALETIEVTEEPETKAVELPPVVKVLVISEPPLEEEPVVSEPQVEEKIQAVKPMEIEEPPVKEDPIIPMTSLWWSAWALILGFALWVMWAIVAVRLQISAFDLGDSTHSAAEVKTLLWGLPTVAGLSGATMMIANGFMVKVGGGRNVTAVTAALLLLPAVGLGITATSQNTGFAVFCILAALSGIGGGFYISSMSYVGRYYADANIFAVLSKNDGIGSLGVSLAFLLIAIVVCFPFGGGFELTHNDWLKSGEKSFLCMAGWIWVPLLLICLAGAIKYLKPTDDENANLSLGMIMLLMLYGWLGCAFVIVGGIFLDYIWLFWILSIAPPLLLLKFFPPAAIKDDVKIAFEVFKLKHTWIMGVMSLMTFGSFIGFAFSFPKLIIDVFGYLPDGSINPNVPPVSTWAWLGPLAGILIRPAAFRLCEEMNSGSAVVLCCTMLQILFGIPIGLSLSIAESSDTPHDYFAIFFCFFILEFLACGMGIVGVAKQIPLMTDVFRKEHHEYVSWATSCIGCYGAFLVPAFFGVTVENHNASYVIYSMIAFYCICLVIQIKYFGLDKY